MIHSMQVTIKPRSAQSCNLSVGHVDPSSLMAVFHYEELVLADGVWLAHPCQQALVVGTHFDLDSTNGTVVLLDHPFWQTEGLWRAADREEPLLYKGQVSAPQRIEVTFDYYVPAQVTVQSDKKTLTGDGVDELTLTVTCEDATVGMVPLAVYNGDGDKVGTLQVTGGSKVIKSTWKGHYRIEADRDVIDSTWSLPVFGPALENGSVEVEVV